MEKLTQRDECSLMEEISLERIKERIRENLRKSQEQPMSTAVLPPEADQSGALDQGRISPKPSMDEVPRPRTYVDRFLWKYGMRYAKIINRIPLIKTIAERHYLRLAYVQALPSIRSMSHHPDKRGIDFLETNWFYHDFFEQTRKEGLKGKIKLWILRSVGFFAWWQAQLNRELH